MATRPKPLSTCRVYRSYPVMAPFRAVPWPRGRILGASLFTIVPFILPILAALAVFAAKPAWGYGSAGAVIAIPAIALGLWACMRYVPLIVLAEMRREAREDEAALAPIGDSERYVGVSYSDGIATLDLDTSWDRGILRWENGRLCFRGFGPAFELPGSMIVDVQPGWAPNPFFKRHRVIVEWAHPEGSREFICMEVRLGRSFRDIRAGAIELAEWIRACRSAGAAEASADERLPFRSSAVSARTMHPRVTVKAKDLFLALGVAVVVWLLAVIAVNVPQRSLRPEQGVFLNDLPPIAALAAFFVALKRARRGGRPGG